MYTVDSYHFLYKKSELHRIFDDKIKLNIASNKIINVFVYREKLGVVQLSSVYAWATPGCFALELVPSSWND